WVFTGGCHHSGTCENYQNQCGNCKFLKHPATHDLSHSTWLRKKAVYEQLPFTIVTCSKWLRKRAEKSSLLQGYAISDIPNPIDISRFYPIAKEQAKSSLHLSTEKNYILFAAVKVKAPGKGYAYFKEAIQQLVQRYPSTQETVELL